MKLFSMEIPILWIICYYAIINILCLMTYYLDKRAAQRGTWRTPESSLHLLSLIGGWPAARYAQLRLAHKYKKRRFMLAYWLTAILHTILILLLMMEIDIFIWIR